MSIDERLEALAQTVEILASMQRENEKRFEQNEKRFEQMFLEVRHHFEIVLDSIRGLESIARAHEQRLDDLEGQ